MLIATEAKEGLLVWRESFGLAIKGGKVGEATIALIYMSSINGYSYSVLDFASKFWTSVPNFAFPNFS